MKREYIYLLLGFILIWILGFLLFMPEKKPQPGISPEGQNTTINK